jgi:hypothetical protein
MNSGIGLNLLSSVILCMIIDKSSVCRAEVNPPPLNPGYKATLSSKTGRVLSSLIEMEMSFPNF